MLRSDSSRESQAVHPTAIVDPRTEVGKGATIGPWCIVEGPVRLGAGVRLVANVHVRGPVEIGAETVVWPFALIGMPPQHARPSPGTPLGVRIGSGVTIREQVTIHQPWEDAGETVVEDGCLLMVGSHVGHDSRVGRGVTMANAAMLGGHVRVGDGAYLSGQAVVHQFVRIGRMAMMQGLSGVSRDVPPYCTAAGVNGMSGLNIVAMRRSGMDRAEITAAREAYRLAFRSGVGRAEQMAALETLAEGSAVVREMLEFVRGASRGIVDGDGRPRPTLRAWLARRGVRGAGGADEVEAGAF